MSYLLCIETAVPAYLHRQEDVAEFFASATQDQDLKRKIRIISKKTGIRQRYSVLGDFTPGRGNLLFNPGIKAAPGVSERMAIFKKEAVKLSVDAVLKIKGFEKLRPQITHVITVTCTGLFAPGLDIELLERLGLNPSTSRSAVNFMGCNAAILAMKQAHEICRNSDKLVLVVCAELCTLHFQEEFSDDYILSNLLFGDGSAAMLIASENIHADTSYSPLRIRSFHSIIVHEGCRDMAWQITEKGFIMNLTSYVSGLLNTNIGRLFSENGISQAGIRHWAVHPGGRKILDDFCTTLGLEKDKLAASFEALEQYGNMSSATILFVLQNIMSAQNKPGENILAAAFGPGLSIETALLEYV